LKSVRPERSAEGAKSKGRRRFDCARCASYAQRERVEIQSEPLPSSRGHEFAAGIRYSAADIKRTTFTESILSYTPQKLAECAIAIAAAGRKLGALGLTPATSSNFSMRLDETHCAITISGRDKGALTADDIMVVDRDGKAVDTSARPSAETLLHTQIYARYPEANAVLHTHSRTQTVASRLYAREGVIRFEGYELQKAIAGYTTHESQLDLPVFANTQHMPDLVEKVDAWIQADKPLYGYLIDGHGIYTWGRDMAETERHIEAFEFLLNCELDLRRLRQ
jgi:methylthioribulose-1-phosphate dehydratase